MLGAVMVIQLGNTAADKQRTACVGYIAAMGYRLAGIVEQGRSSADAVAMVARGLATVVVVAFGGRELAVEVIAAGGRVEAVHPTPHVVEPPAPPPANPRSVVGLLAQLRARGRSVEEIASFLGESTGEIRRMLRRGER